MIYLFGFVALMAVGITKTYVESYAYDRKFPDRNKAKAKDRPLDYRGCEPGNCW